MNNVSETDNYLKSKIFIACRRSREKHYSERSDFPEICTC